MGPWGESSRQEDLRDPLGDKAERNNEENMEEEEEEQGRRVYLQV